MTDDGITIPVKAWYPFIISPDEAAKIDPDLVWVYSEPIKTDTGEVIAVLNVDCVGAQCQIVTRKGVSGQW